MFTDYDITNFFTYKGTFREMGFTGQDYDGGGRLLFLITSIILLLILWIVFRKAQKKHVLTFIRIFAITLTSLYIIKTTWESICDITIGDGNFNEGILPLDTCSIPMLAGFLAGWGKGKVKEAAEGWLVAGNIIGGISNLLFLRALNYYPYFTFGAMYSMFWHFIMVFLGVWMIITNYVELNFKLVLSGFALHMAFSLIVIPYNYIRGWDFMLYRQAGGAPLIEGISEKLWEAGVGWITTPIMIVTYFGLFSAIIYAAKGIKGLVHLIPTKKDKEEIPA